jgi:DNA polymerase III, delta subunit/LAGLIDADG DNA endonuclease family
MSYVPLHHKYRPQTFAQLVGQEAIATTLSNALNKAQIAPAYLFTGARGTGKTSSARIFAKSLNCIAGDRPTPDPCGECETCRSITKGNALDVIEIDAASNTGVDNIRELIDRAQFAPVQCRYKVYVIDECLTGDALVLTQDGWQRIDDPAIKGKAVLSYNENSELWEWKRVKRWLVRGEKPTLIIKTDRREIRCTGNHLIRTAEGWTKAQDLQIGAPIVSPVNAAAVKAFSNTVAIAASVGSSGGTSSEATSLAARTTTWPQSWLKQNPCGQSANVAAAKSWTFQSICSEKVRAWWASRPIGVSIPIDSITASGRNAQTISPNSWDNSLTMSMDYGTLLGDTSIVYPNAHSRFPRLSWTHGQSQKEWLGYKASRLAALQPKLYTTENKGYGDRSICGRTACHPELVDVFQVVRPQCQGKQVSSDWLARVTPEGLAWWYMDDGSINFRPSGTGSIQLHTEGFSPSENQLLAQWLTDLGYPTKSLSYRSTKRDKDFFYLAMGARSTQKWIADLQQYAIPSMEYKFRDRSIDRPRNH